MNVVSGDVPPLDSGGGDAGSVVAAAGAGTAVRGPIRLGFPRVGLMGAQECPPRAAPP